MSKFSFETNEMTVDGKLIKSITEKFYTMDKYEKLDKNTLNALDNLCRNGYHKFLGTRVTLDKTGRLNRSLAYTSNYDGKPVGINSAWYESTDSISYSDYFDTFEEAWKSREEAKFPTSPVMKGYVKE